MTNPINNNERPVVFHASSGSGQRKPRKSRMALAADQYAKDTEGCRLAEYQENAILKLFPHLTSTEKLEFSQRIRKGQTSYRKEQTSYKEVRQPLGEADKTKIIRDLIFSAKAEALNSSGKKKEPPLLNATQQAEQRAVKRVRVQKARVEKAQLKKEELAPIKEISPQAEEAEVSFHVKKEEPPRWVEITKKEEKLLKKEKGGITLFRKKEDVSKKEESLPPVAEQLDTLEKSENPEDRAVLKKLHARQKKLTRRLEIRLEKAGLDAEIKQAREQIAKNIQATQKTDSAESAESAESAKSAKSSTSKPITITNLKDLKAQHEKDYRKHYK